MNSNWYTQQIKRNKLIDSAKTESIEEFKARGGKVVKGPDPQPLKSQYTKARNVRLNGLWDGIGSSRKGF